MKQIVRQVKIIGTGSYTPEKIYTNKDIENFVDTNDKWIYENLGIRERHIAAENESTSDLATKAGLKSYRKLWFIGR